MFNIANTSEKLRIASFDCRQEVVVDMFAGRSEFWIFHNKHCNYTTEILQVSDTIRFHILCTRVQSTCSQSIGTRMRLKHCTGMWKWITSLSDAQYWKVIAGRRVASHGLHYALVFQVAPIGVSDRVNLGLLPSSKPHWLIGCRCLKQSGGILHIHELITPNQTNVVAQTAIQQSMKS